MGENLTGEDVTRFYREILPTMSPEEIMAIQYELLSADSEPETGEPLSWTYEEDVPIPKLSESPEASDFFRKR
jgi:hypothetical protein